ncbi:hypothetical protein HYV50_03260 [Candidatus Pacearchaeota archaeon]|nr:hypothetical protein [Candidatus Pacearchaeota archaeon]
MNKGKIVWVFLIFFVIIIIYDVGAEDLFTHNDGLNFQLTSSGEIGINKEGKSLGSLRFVVTGVVNRENKTYNSEDFIWNSIYSNYTSIEQINKTTNISYLVDVLTNYNNHQNFRWTQILEFHPKKAAKLKHSITNNFGYNLTNVKFWYVNVLSEGTRLIYDNEERTLRKNETVHLRGSFNDKIPKFDFYDYEFRFGDLINSGFNITDIYIGNGSIFGYYDGSIVALGLTNENSMFLNGLTIRLDPEITPYKSPSACDTNTQQWANCNNTFVSDNARADESTLYEVMHAHNFSFISPTENLDESWTVHGIEVSVEGRSAVSFCAAGRQADIGVDLNYNLSSNISYTSGRVINTFGCTETTIIYGNLTYDWGRNWSKRELTNQEFGVRLNFTDNGGTAGIAAVDQVQVRLNFTRIFGNPPNINLNAPANNSIINTRYTLLNWSVRDIENNTIESIVYGNSNLTKIDESIINRKKFRGNGTNFIEQTYNWSVPPLIDDGTMWGLYHFDNRKEFNESGEGLTTGIIHDFSSHNFDGDTPSEPANIRYDNFSGILGGAYNFTGSIGINILNQTAHKDLCNNGCSFSMWVKKKTSGTGNIILARWGTSGTTNNRFFRFRTSSPGSFIFDIGENGNSTFCSVTAQNWTLEEWRMVTGTWENSTGNLSLYVNNIITTVNSTICNFKTINITAWQDTETTWIGDDEVGVGTFLGVIDEVGIWNRTLSPAEVDNLYKLNQGQTYFWNVNASDGNSTGFNGTRQFQIISPIIDVIEVTTTETLHDIYTRVNNAQVFNNLSDSSRPCRYVSTADINVTSTGKLIMESCTLEMNNSIGDAENSIYVSGNLSANYSNITRSNTFRHEFQVLTGSEFILKNSYVSYAGSTTANLKRGLAINTSNVIFENNTLSNAEVSDLELLSSNISIIRSKFLGNLGGGTVTDFNIYCTFCSNIKIIDSNISGSNLENVVVSSNQEIYLINTNHSTHNVINGTLYKQWYVDVRVQDHLNNSLSGARVLFYNNTGGLTHNITTNSSGNIVRQNVTEYTVNGSARTYQTNYTINASKVDYVTGTQSLNLTKSTNLTFILMPS